MNFEIIDNPEWLKFEVDAEQHILFGIKRDGTVDWSIGIPEPKKKKLIRLKNDFGIREN